MNKVQIYRMVEGFYILSTACLVNEWNYAACLLLVIAGVGTVAVYAKRLTSCGIVVGTILNIVLGITSWLVPSVGYNMIGIAAILSAVMFYRVLMKDRESMIWNGFTGIAFIGMSILTETVYVIPALIGCFLAPCIIVLSTSLRIKKIGKRKISVLE